MSGNNRSDNLAIDLNSVVVLNTKQAYGCTREKLYTYGLDRQWATATTSVK